MEALLDFTSSLIAEAVGALASKILIGINVIKSLIDVAKECDGVAFALVAYISIVLTAALFLLGVLLTISFGFLVAAFVGALLGIIIGLVLSEGIIPVVCKK